MKSSKFIRPNAFYPYPSRRLSSNGRSYCKPCTSPAIFLQLYFAADGWYHKHGRNLLSI